jgi:hypothetical protein
MRVCAECQFYAADVSISPEHQCTAIIDLVTGEQKNVDCYEARAASWLCGHEGNLFKQRGEAGVDPRKVHGEPPSLSIAGGNRRDLKRGRSDDGPQRAEGGA